MSLEAALPKHHLNYLITEPLCTIMAVTRLQSRFFEIEMKSLFEDKAPSKLEDYQKLKKTKPAGFKRQGIF